MHRYSAHLSPEGLFVHFSVQGLPARVGSGHCQLPVCPPDPGDCLQAVGSTWPSRMQPFCSWSHQGREELGGSGSVLSTFHLPGISPWVIFTPALPGREDSPNR